MVALVQPTAPDVQKLERIVREAVAKKRLLFKAYPDLSVDDLVQQCLPRALDMHAKFNPVARGRFNNQAAVYATWITRGVNFALLDVAKGRRLEQRRIEVVRSSVAEHHEDTTGALAEIREWFHAGCPIEKGEASHSLIPWANVVYRNAREVFPARCGKRGRSWFSPALVVTIAAIMKRQRLTTRGCEQLLLDCEELRRAVGITKGRGVPSHYWFATVSRRAETLLSIQPQ